ncbi:hypothetical protein IAT40_000459 [Kwoniella sp. CBS 6097]
MKPLHRLHQHLPQRGSSSPAAPSTPTTGANGINVHPSRMYSYKHRFRSNPPRPIAQHIPAPVQETSSAPTSSEYAPGYASHEVDITLSTPHNERLNTYGPQAILMSEVKDRFEISHIEDAEQEEVSACSPTPSSTQSSQDVTDNVTQAVRPRLGGKGVGAVVRHLGGSAGRGGRATNVARAGGTSRWLACTKGLLHHSEDDVHYDLSLIPAFGNPVTSEEDSIEVSTCALVAPGSSQVNIHQSAIQPKPLASSTSTAPVPAVQRRNPLPDLTRVAPPNYVASLIASPPSASINGRPATRPFALTPPPYTDDDIPPPEPYNLAYPHPLTAYASPGVNPETVKASGYGQLLEQLVRDDLQYAVGTILYEAGFRSMESSVYLLFSFGGSHGNGNGIPESLWSKLENANPTRLPVGVAGVSPFARGAINPELTTDLPPRFSAQLQQAQTIDHGMLTPASSVSETDYFTPKPGQNMLSNRIDFDSTPRPSPGHAPMRHTASLGYLGGFASSSTGVSQAAPWHQGSHFQSRVHPRQADTTDVRRTSINTTYQPPLTPSRTHQSGVSPFYKTELCAMWEHMGKCKYEGQCQYAHGQEDLRLPRHLQQRRTEVSHLSLIGDDKEPIEMHEYPSEGIMYPAPHRVISSRSYAPLRRDQSYDQNQQHRFEPRRASCPPQQLFPLAEAEPLTDQPQSYPEMLPAPAPIGAERSSRLPTARRTTGTRQSTSTPAPPTSAWADAEMPAFNLMCESGHMSTYTDSSAPSTTFLRSEPSTLSLSLSTSSGSRFSMYTNYDDAEADKVAEGYQAVDDGIPKIGSGVGHGRGSGTLANSTSLDFSTGKSIWR